MNPLHQAFAKKMFEMAAKYPDQDSQRTPDFYKEVEEIGKSFSSLIDGGESIVKDHEDGHYIWRYLVKEDAFVLVVWKGNNDTACIVSTATTQSWGSRYKEALNMLIQRGYEYVSHPNFPNPPWGEDPTGSHKVGIWSDENTRFLSGVPESKPNLVIVK